MRIRCTQVSAPLSWPLKTLAWSPPSSLASYSAIWARAMTSSAATSSSPVISATPMLAMIGGPDLALAQDGADVAGDDHRLVLVDLGEDQGELVAAEPGDHVGGARPGAEDLRDGLEHHIAGGAAVAVVDQLEVVDVEHQQGAGARVPRRVGQLALQLADEPRPVEDAGQEVVLSKMLEG